MRFLLISLFALLLSCASYPVKNDFKIIPATQNQVFNPYFSDAKLDYIYKAHLQFNGYTLSGIFIVKKIEDKHYRIVFTTEMGNTIFDFTLQNNVFQTNQILPDINKKWVVNILQKDFRVLLKENALIAHGYNLSESIIYEVKINNMSYYYYSMDDQLKKIAGVQSRKEIVNFIFSDVEKTMAQKIEIIHAKLNLRITLKAI